MWLHKGVFERKSLSVLNMSHLRKKRFLRNDALTQIKMLISWNCD